jgi:molybdopterin-binding protein
MSDRGDRHEDFRRNQLEGIIVGIVKGATTAHVKLDVGGATVTSAITNAASTSSGSSSGRRLMPWSRPPT